MHANGVASGTEPDLAGYRGAVADLLLEIASHTGPEDLPKAERVLTERLASAEFAAVLAASPGGLSRGRGPAAPRGAPLSARRPQLRSRPGRPYPDSPFRPDRRHVVGLGPGLRAGFGPDRLCRPGRSRATPPPRGTPFPLSAPGPGPAAAGGARGGPPAAAGPHPAHRGPALRPGPAAGGNPAQPAGGRLRRRRARNPPLWVTSLARSIEQQRRLRALGYTATLPSAHCVGYAMDIEMSWFRRFGAAATLEGLLAERQQAGEVNAIDEGQTWHLCLSPAAVGARPGPTELTPCAASRSSSAHARTARPSARCSPRWPRAARWRRPWRPSGCWPAPSGCGSWTPSGRSSPSPRPMAGGCSATTARSSTTGCSRPSSPAWATGCAPTATPRWCWRPSSNGARTR